MLERARHREGAAHGGRVASPGRAELLDRVELAEPPAEFEVRHFEGAVGDEVRAEERLFVFRHDTGPAAQERILFVLADVPDLVVRVEEVPVVEVSLDALKDLSFVPTEAPESLQRGVFVARPENRVRRLPGRTYGDALGKALDERGVPQHRKREEHDARVRRGGEVLFEGHLVS